MKIIRTWWSNEMILFSPYTCRLVKKQALLSANFRKNIYYNSAMFLKPHQWPTPSESIAIYCVRKLDSCIAHLQSCSKFDIWKKRKNYALLLRSKLKITKIEDYKNFLQKFKVAKIEDYKNLAQLQHLPLNTATTLFNEASQK